jgi:hypothetical protein
VAVSTFLLVLVMVAGGVAIVWFFYAMIGSNGKQEERFRSMYGFGIDVMADIKEHLPPPPVGYFWSLSLDTDYFADRSVVLRIMKTDLTVVGKRSSESLFMTANNERHCSYPSEKDAYRKKIRAPLITQAEEWQRRYSPPPDIPEEIIG